MSYDLQLIDCNCNDCKFMQRDIEKYNQSQDLHKKWQLDEFNRNVMAKKQLALKARRENELLKYNNLLVEAEKMKFQFNRNESKINYGKCLKLGKDVSFLPGVCQLDTQECFKHRKDE